MCHRSILKINVTPDVCESNGFKFIEKAQNKISLYKRRKIEVFIKNDSNVYCIVNGEK
jgi:hypothetical protein